MCAVSSFKLRRKPRTPLGTKDGTEPTERAEPTIHSAGQKRVKAADDR